MAILKIYKYPHPVLRAVGERVTAFDETLQTLVADMIETLYACTGAIGLAAQQVGQPLQVFVMDMAAASTKDQLRVYINPEIVQASRNKTMREGCLSFPEYLANVKRPQKITVKAQDQWGQWFEQEATMLEAVCIQHEMDHLNGVLMIDRIESLKTDWITRQPKPLNPELADEEAS
ncbi:MAG: peptide deformylase [Candidatus Melainabacteria bacterium]|jgi:peptide deformylase|nr:peptide deformylase [Candidatus Melainabacteria bacterium]